MSGFFIDNEDYPPISHIALRHPEITELVYAGIDEWSTLPWLRGQYEEGRFKEYVSPISYPWWGPRPDSPALQDWMKTQPGVGGMLTPSYRWDQLRSDLLIMNKYVPQGYNFYIYLEVDIVALGDHPRLAAAWEAYMIEVCRNVYARRPEAEVLWSPFAWELWSGVSQFRKARTKEALRTLFWNVAAHSGTKGITTLDLQDGRGAQPEEPETDAVNWYNLIKDCGPKVRINMEYFTPNWQPQPPEEMDRRRAYYKAHNAPLGCCWALRYW